MSVDHWKQLQELYKSSTINSSENIPLQNFGGSSLCKSTEFLNGFNSNTIDICPSSFAICLAQFTRLFYSSLQLYLSNEPDVILDDVNDLYHIILKTIQQFQQQPVPPNTAPATEPCFGANEDSKYDPDEPSEDTKDEDLLLPQPDNPVITDELDLQDDFYGTSDIDIHEPAPFEEEKDEDLIILQQDNDGISYKLDAFIFDVDEQSEEIKDQDLVHQDNHGTNTHDLQGDFYGTHSINTNEPVPSEELKDAEDLFIPHPDNDDIFYKLDEFIFEYNQPREIAHQISGSAVTRCFMDNIMDYTDFKDLKSNLKRYGIPAGPARKLWRFLNPVKKNENEQDDEDVVVIPIGFYMYMPGISDEISFEIDDDDNNDEECVGFKIGDNLSVPSDWSDNDH